MSSNSHVPARSMRLAFALLCAQALPACDAPIHPARDGSATYIHDTITHTVGDGEGQDEWLNLTDRIGKAFTSPSGYDGSLIEVASVAGEYLMDCLRTGEGTLMIFTTEWETYKVKCVHEQGTGS